MGKLPPVELAAILRKQAEDALAELSDGTAVENSQPLKAIQECLEGLVATVEAGRAAIGAVEGA